MSDSDCSNCDKSSCPYRPQDHYTCWIRRAKDVQEFSLQNDLAILKDVRPLMKKMYDETLCEEAYQIFNNVNEMIQLLETDTSVVKD